MVAMTTRLNKIFFLLLFSQNIRDVCHIACTVGVGICKKSAQNRGTTTELTARSYHAVVLKYLTTSFIWTVCYKIIMKLPSCISNKWRLHSLVNVLYTIYLVHAPAIAKRTPRFIFSYYKKRNSKHFYFTLKWL